MRPTARLIRTALLSLSLGVVAWTCAAGGAAGATKLYDGVSDTDSVVATPLATSPADGAALAYPANAVRLAWQPVAGAAAYAVQVARQPTSGSCSSATTFLTDGILLSGTTTDTTWIPAMVDKASGSDIWLGGFCWRVRTTGTGSSAGAWSTPRGFTRTWSSAPSTLRFYNDTDGPIPRTSTDPDFASGDATTRNAGYVAWSPVAGAATYDLEVATSRSFSKGATILTQHGIRASRSVIPHLSDDTYYWRVRANSSSGVAGTWSSDDNSFTVEWDDDAWTATANLYPLDSATTSEVRVGWTPVAGA
ncbi:MAG: hypothetical protein JWN72_2824, partial [Thermoleophilia bacterium]|nr:hypothetical protein [Thermoleophilia bacterium]